MRLSGLVLMFILVISTAFAQRSSSGASSGGSYHGGGSYSGAGASHASSVGSSRAVSSTSGDAVRARTVNGSGSTSKAAKAPDHSLASLFHHRKPEPTPTPVTQRMFIPRCRRGVNCGVCPGGSRNAFGQCVYPTQGCIAGQVWNGFGCGSAYYLSSCGNLASQLALMDRWQNQRDPSMTWRRKLLLDQYQECVLRFGGNPFRLYALNGIGLFDVP
jgi:hypothetical protein